MRLIDADALLEDDTTVIQEYFDGYCKFGYSRKQIEEAPTIDPVKHGKWIKQNPMVDTEECSECGYNIPDEDFRTPFCPWCGALMVEGEVDK